MPSTNDYCTLGVSVALLYPEAFQDSYRHLAAFGKAARLPGFEALEACLPEEEAIRKTEIAILRDSGRQLNYNLPGSLQQEGEFNPNSLDPACRKNALALAMRHVDYAAEADCEIAAITSGPDNPARREEAVACFEEFLLALADHAQQYDMTLVLEPIERQRFKKLLLGPTRETAACALSVQKQGRSNVRMLLDMAHVPLMEENLMEAVEASLPAGIGHVHLGNAIVRNSANPYYGHFHPPIGTHDGEYDLDDLVCLFSELIKCGYLSRKPRECEKNRMSVEMMPYPGVSPETSAQFVLEKINTALEIALAA